MEKLTYDHISSLIDSESYQTTPQYIQCILMVGEAPIIGISYCFNQKHVDVEAGKKSARKHAIDQLFEFEAYHQKRLRPTTSALSSDQVISDMLANAAPRDIPLFTAGVDAKAAIREFLETNKLIEEGSSDEQVKTYIQTLTDNCNAFLDKFGINPGDFTGLAEKVEQLKAHGSLVGKMDDNVKHVHQGVSGMDVFTHAPEYLNNKKVVREREAPSHTWVEPIPLTDFTARLCEYENRIREGNRGCLSILTEDDIVELNNCSNMFKPKHIYVDPELKFDISTLEGYVASVEGRDGDFVLA